MAQHDAPRSDPDIAGGGGDAGDEDLRRGTREPVGAVVLGQPIAAIAEPLHRLREPNGLLDGVRGAAPAANGRLVERAEMEHLELPGGKEGETYPSAVGQAIKKRKACRMGL